MTRQIIATVLGITLTLFLSACGSATDSEDAQGAAGEKAAPPESTLEVEPVLPQLGEDKFDLYSEVETAKCETGEGKLTASGKVTNPKDTKSDIAISVIWFKSEGGASQVLKSQAKKGVKPGKTVPWKITANVKNKADTCFVKVQGSPS